MVCQCNIDFGRLYKVWGSSSEVWTWRQPRKLSRGVIDAQGGYAMTEELNRGIGSIQWHTVGPLHDAEGRC